MDEFEVEDYVDQWMLLATGDFQDDGNEWFATIEKLPGMWGAGTTRPEALADLRQALNNWAHMTLAEGETLPELAAAAA